MRKYFGLALTFFLLSGCAVAQTAGLHPGMPTLAALPIPSPTIDAPTLTLLPSATLLPTSTLTQTNTPAPQIPFLSGTPIITPHAAIQPDNLIHIVELARWRTGNVRQVAYSPDGHLLASVTQEHAITLWNAATGQEEQNLMGDSVAFSPDGSLLAFHPDHQQVELWDLAAGQTLRKMNGNVDNIKSLAFSPDGGSLAAASIDYRDYAVSINLWDVATGRLLHSLRTPADLIHADCVGSSACMAPNPQLDVSLAFSPDGKIMASNNHFNMITLWNAMTVQELNTFGGGQTDAYRIAFSPDGKTLASIWDQSEITLWNILTGEKLSNFGGYPSMPSSIAFSPAGDLLVSGSTDGVLEIWSIPTGESLRRISAHTGIIYTVSFSPDGRFLVSGCEDGTIRIWGVVP